jgi:ribosomal protein L11 methyltransferase
MLELEPGGAFLDLGCGSGVLAIAAAKLGWDPVRALDNDPSSLEATERNARANGVEIEVFRHDLRTDPVPEAPTVGANLLAPLLTAWAGRLPDGNEPPQRIIASGVLTDEVGTVVRAFASLGLREATRRGERGWAALLLERSLP